MTQTNSIDLNHALYYVVPNPGYLLLQGPDRHAYVQRQTTNDVKLLSKDLSITTVLTSPLARILDVLQLIEEPDGTGAITLPGYAEATYNFLRRRIFFNDQVTLIDRSKEFCQILLEGTGAEALLNQLGDAPQILGGVLTIETGGVVLRVIKQPGLSGTGYRLVANATDQETLEEVLKSHQAVQLDQASYDHHRITAGMPAAGHELTEVYTPFEAGLGYAISHTKGCYTGQEVIARQITYDKVTKQMVGLKLTAPAAPGMKVAAVIEGDTQPAGEITSAGQSPELGSIALAVLKRPFFEVGVKILVNGEIGGEVVPLPIVK